MVEPHNFILFKDIVPLNYKVIGVLSLLDVKDNITVDKVSPVSSFLTHTTRRDSAVEGAMNQWEEQTI
jgi:hypothetical protein